MRVLSGQSPSFAVDIPTYIGYPHRRPGGSGAAQSCESRQVRKEAAVSRRLRVPPGSLPGHFIMQVTYLRSEGFIRKGDSMDMTQTEAPNVNDKREIFGWAMYDWANSAFSTTIGTVFLGPFAARLAT